MVTRDHDSTDTSFLGLSDRLFSFRTLRVDHTDQTGKDQVRFDCFSRHFSRYSSDVFECHRQYTQCLDSQAVVCVQDCVSVSICDW